MNAPPTAIIALPVMPTQSAPTKSDAVRKAMPMAVAIAPIAMFLQEPSNAPLPLSARRRAA
jgi:hypothetical protein